MANKNQKEKENDGYKYTLLGFVKLDVEIETETGLLIKGPEEISSLGAIDAKFIRHADGRIYIPGSSLKGRMRSALELALGCSNDGKPCSSRGDVTKHIPRIFGEPDSDYKEVMGPTRIIVTDFELEEGSDLITTEIKAENSINRSTLTAENPRKIERVPPGTKFRGNIFVKFYKREKVKKEKQDGNNTKITIEPYQIKRNGKDIDSTCLEICNLYYTVVALKAVQKLYGLGNSVSRGYGRIKFNINGAEIYRVNENALENCFSSQGLFIYSGNLNLNIKEEDNKNNDLYNEIINELKEKICEASNRTCDFCQEKENKSGDDATRTDSDNSNIKR